MQYNTENAARHVASLHFDKVPIGGFKVSEMPYKEDYPLKPKYPYDTSKACADMIAQAFANVITRETDLVARYGGEEFACVLPNTLLEGALTVAEILRKKIMEFQIPHAHPAGGGNLTISLGVATMIPDETTDYRTLTKAADEALYRSKESGRNKVSH